jgi:hypothetical protein
MRNHGEARIVVARRIPVETLGGQGLMMFNAPTPSQHTSGSMRRRATEMPPLASWNDQAR